MRLAAFLLAALGLPVPPGPRRPEACIVRTNRAGCADPIAGERELPQPDRARRNPRYYSEYIDAGRFQDPNYQSAFRDFLRLKYRGTRFDVVIAMLDVAIEFVDKNKDDLFPGTPTVFYALSPLPRGISNSAGLIAQVNFKGTINLAMALQPDVREVFVVSGAGDRDKAFAANARPQFQLFEPRLTFTYLSGLPTNELEQRLRTLPERSIVYYLLVYQDGAGGNFQPVEYLDRISAVAKRPIYSWVDSTLDHGVVGGSMQRLDAQIDAVADLALRVLRGESADSIGTLTPDLNVNHVDWRQLERWGISEAQVPAGTTVLFREANVWDRYKIYILGAAALLLLQTALIAGLLVQAARRRRAEEQVRFGQSALRTSYDRIQDLGRRLLSAQEAERARLARELHDDISQQLALLAMDLELLMGSGPGPREEADKTVREALERAQLVARSVHDLSHRLHPAKLRLIGLVPALNSLQREHTQPGLAISFSHDNVPDPLPQELTLCLFRIVQEALQNTIKHSGARTVSVRLTGGHDRLALTIEDDGVGFDVAAAWGKGLGLISMGERLESVGGTLNIQSRPGAGVRLESTVPVGAQPAAIAAV